MYASVKFNYISISEKEKIRFKPYNIPFQGCVIILYPLKLVTHSVSMDITAWKVSKYGIFSGPHFPVFGPEKTPYLDTFQAVYTWITRSCTNLY